MLNLKNIKYTYSNSTKSALNDVSLEISKHQKTAILGHNGSGKSTLFLIADGLIKPQSGTLYLHGKPLTDDRSTLRHWRRNIGLAFQDPDRQLVAATVAEDVSYGLCNLQLSENEIARQLDRTLTEFELQDLANTPIHHLSLGQKRRVALAGVMAVEPELLLLDEPTAYLDRSQLQTFRRNLDRLSESGTTLVVATHNLDFAYDWADRILVLHQGRLVLDGTPDTVFTRSREMPHLNLGMPQLWEIWKTLCPSDESPSPRNLDELKQRL
ncbi:MAG: ABC transporter ATP-binding protein [Cyanobacteria bacterium SID2]|nr:ABC transporter ATP-binding protein [Cyanobacteria bacterium SID2]MBP0004919.1 ABC transporter ATP-binding protein [Cyanobacteria bacterium SBC]